MVFYNLDYPQSALAHEQRTKNFRVGDRRFSKLPAKIIKIEYYKDTEPRYVLDNNKYIAYTENQLLKDTSGKPRTYEVKKIIGKKKINNTIHYLVLWKGYNKKDATYEKKSELVKDGLIDLINEYEGK